ncbi:MAG: peptidoglycan-binding domain-containing protein [Kofleriaceae bacterium]|nr:peptidoglycan-binding domain-containing protein [Kofleriaceae bacterium]
MRGLYALALAACAGSSGGRTVVSTTNAQSPTARASSEVRFAVTEATTEVTCPDAAMRIDGRLVCPNEASAQGLTIIDLRDEWAPRLFATQPDGTAPVFRETYLALAADRSNEKLAELYGVVPSLAIVRERLADEARHACHAEIDPTPILALARPYAQDHGPLVKASDATRKVLAKQLEAERKKRDLPDIEALAEVKGFGPRVAKWKTTSALHEGIVAAQQKLVCEGFLAAKDADGSMTWRTSNAVELFQRRNFLMPNERLDQETREAMQLDSHELDFRLALRILRERVVDATGLVEDGTASAGPQPILGRLLDPAPMRAARGRVQPLPDGAPDLISAATEAAARELGWTDPAAVRAFLEHHAAGLRVAIKLPPVPAYHAKHMDLKAEIDRGDVWYDDKPIPRKVTHRPTLVVFVDDNGTKRPLIRWPTTIGGWSDVRMKNGRVVQRWKESDVGPSVWRNLFAAPTWLPPPTTPDRDLVRNTYIRGAWELKTSIMGPGPHAAYGLVLLKHDNEVTKKDGTVTYWDNGIGTHGSASVTSIVNGTSHGCHRLYNQLAVRLATFLLAHRDHEVRGEQAVTYRRRVNHKGSFLAKVDTRGFLYELTPPVPVDVKKGNIKTKRKVPPKASAPARPD